MIPQSPIIWNKEQPEGVAPPGEGQECRLRGEAQSLGGLLVLSYNVKYAEARRETQLKKAIT